MTTSTERVTRAESEDGRYECCTDGLGGWVVLEALPEGDVWDLTDITKDAPGLDAQIVLGRFLATLTRCPLCDKPSDDLKGGWDGPSGAEIWVAACPACRGEE